jgi:very-short-patch-repair endonuclease
MLVVEVDGDSHAFQESYDARRTAFLENEGYRVLRFTNREVAANLETVLKTIADALDNPLSPTLSPKGAREKADSCLY